MILIILAGLWALIRGQITLAPRLKLTGERARIFGVLSIVFALFLMMPIIEFLVKIFPSILSDVTITRLFDLVFIFCVLFALSYVSKFIKIPRRSDKKNDSNS